MKTKTHSSYTKHSLRRKIVQLRQICLLLAIVVALSSFTNTAGAVDQLTSGTNSRKIRQQAVQAIPFQQLTPEMRAKITPIIEKPSIYRRLPVTAIDIDPDYYLYLVRYPEVVVNIWQLMGITQMTLDRTAPFMMKSNDGAGAVADVELIYGTNNLNIYHAKGTYSGPLLKRKLHGSCVIILRTNYRTGPSGAPQVVSSLDVFLKVENATANLIAKTVNPIVGSSADHNFVESMNFVQRLHETTEKNGYGVQRMADRLVNLTPEVRAGFVKAAGVAYQRSNQRKQDTAASPARSKLKPPAANVGYESQMQNYVPPRSAPTTTQPSYPNIRASRSNFQQYDRASEGNPSTRPRQIQPAMHYQSQSPNSHLANPVFYENHSRAIKNRSMVQPPVYQQPY